MEILLNQRSTKSPNYKKYSATVDAEDYDRVNSYKWSVRVEKHTKYAVCVIKGKLVRMHIFILGGEEGKEIDHIDSNGLNNTRTNLRFVTRLQNISNSRSAVNSSSKHKGVNWFKPTNGWQARLRIHGKVVWVAYFKDEDEAGRAYNEKAMEYFGEYAKLNDC